MGKQGVVLCLQHRPPRQKLQSIARRSAVLCLSAICSDASGRSWLGQAKIAHACRQLTRRPSECVYGELKEEKKITKTKCQLICHLFRVERRGHGRRAQVDKLMKSRLVMRVRSRLSWSSQRHFSNEVSTGIPKDFRKSINFDGSEHSTLFIRLRRSFCFRKRLNLRSRPRRSFETLSSCS
jgi:hypothetical protein